jgi:hypothetical protein
LVTYEIFSTQIAPPYSSLNLTYLPLYIDFFLAGRTLRAPLLSLLPSLPPRVLANLLGIKTLSLVASKSTAPLLKVSSFSNLFLFLADKALASNSGSDSQLAANWVFTWDIVIPPGKTLSWLAWSGAGVRVSSSGVGDINIIPERLLWPFSCSGKGDFSLYSLLISKYIYICLELVFFC